MLDKIHCIQHLIFAPPLLHIGIVDFYRVDDFWLLRSHTHSAVSVSYSGGSSIFLLLSQLISVSMTSIKIKYEKQQQQ